MADTDRESWDDARLVRSAREAADSAAFGHLITRYRSQLVRLAESFMDGGSEVEDCVQEACIRAYGNLELLADPDRFGSWLRRILFGCCMDSLRRRRRNVAALDEAEKIASQEPGTGRTSPSAVNLIEANEFAARVLNTIDALPDRDAVPLRLFHLDGLRYASIASYLGVKESSARSLVTRARQRLKGMLAMDMEKERTSGHLTEVLRESVWERGKTRLRGGILHILNGKTVVDSLARSDVPGDKVEYSDVFHEGPVDATLGDEAFVHKRVAYLVAMGGGRKEQIGEQYARGERGLRAFRKYDEVVLWFEHDLYDQLLLIHHLAFYLRCDPRPTKLSLICIGRYPGMPSFRGLGDLSPMQLASLLDTRQLVGEAQLELGAKAWQAFGSPDPSGLLHLIEHADFQSLPFLRAALIRHLEQFPSVRNGLGLSEQYALEGIAEGIARAGPLFRYHQDREEAVFMGDGTFYYYLQRLAANPAPLIRYAEKESGSPAMATCGLTPVGRRVLAGDADAVELRGIDRWFGGVHLEDREAKWRWNERKRSLEEQS